MASIPTPATTPSEMGESKFVNGLADMQVQEQAKRVHHTVDDIGVDCIRLLTGIERFKATKAVLGEHLNRLTPQRRLEALKPSGVETIVIDRNRLLDAADEIIRQGHRLRAIAEQELCEGFLEVALAASVEVLQGGDAA